MDNETLTADEFLRAYAEKVDNLTDIENNYNEGYPLTDEELVYLIREARHATNFALKFFLTYQSELSKESSSTPES